MEWRKIPGFSTYSVSENGDVRNDKTGYPLKTRRKDKKKRYFMVGLCLRGKQRSFYVHRLVLLAFVGNPPKGYSAAHNDGNPENNHVSNLRWATHQENMQDQVKHGTSRRGTNNPNAKLDEEKVREIRRLRAETDIPTKDLCEMYGVGATTIRAAVSRRHWGYVH